MTSSFTPARSGRSKSPVTKSDICFGRHQSPDGEGMKRNPSLRAIFESRLRGPSRNMEVESEGTAGAALGSGVRSTSIKPTEVCFGKGHTDTELIRRNREIAQVRDLLCQRDQQIEDWKGRHGELVSKLADTNGELVKSRAKWSRQAAESECTNEVHLEARSTELIQQLRHELEEERSRVTTALQVAEDASAAREQAIEEAATAKHDSARDVELFERQRCSQEALFDSVAAAAEAARLQLEEDLQAARTVAEPSGPDAKVLSWLKDELANARQETSAAYTAAAVATAEAATSAAANAEVQSQLQQDVADAHAEADKARAEADKARTEVAQAREGAAEVSAAVQSSEACAWRMQQDLEALRLEMKATQSEASQKVKKMELQHAAEREVWKSSAIDTSLQTLSSSVNTQECPPTAESLEELEELESLTANSQELSDMEQRNSASRLKALEEQVESERCKRQEAEESTAAIAAQLEACEAASLARVLDSQPREQRLRKEGVELAERVCGLEDELREFSRHEARARTLQTECGGLRHEVGALQKLSHEHRESIAMLTEEARTRKMKADEVASDNAKLRVQLDESRRARSMEMHALITKMSCTPTRSSAKSALKQPPKEVTPAM